MARWLGPRSRRAVGLEVGKDYTFHIVGDRWCILSRMSLMCKNGGGKSPVKVE